MDINATTVRTKTSVYRGVSCGCVGEVVEMSYDERLAKDAVNRPLRSIPSMPNTFLITSPRVRSQGAEVCFGVRSRMALHLHCLGYKILGIIMGSSLEYY